MISNLATALAQVGFIVLVTCVLAVCVAGVWSLVDRARSTPPVALPARNYRTSVVSPSALARFNNGSLTPAEFLSLAVAESKGHPQDEHVDLIPAQRVVERRTTLPAVAVPSHSTDHTPTGRLTTVK